MQNGVKSRTLIGFLSARFDQSYRKEGVGLFELRTLVTLRFQSSRYYDPGLIAVFPGYLVLLSPTPQTLFASNFPSSFGRDARPAQPHGSPALSTCFHAHSNVPTDVSVQKRALLFRSWTSHRDHWPEVKLASKSPKANFACECDNWGLHHLPP